MYDEKLEGIINKKTKDGVKRPLSSDWLNTTPEGYAVVDIKELEKDLLELYGYIPMRFPSIEMLCKQERLSEFIRLTRKYIVSGTER